MKKSLVVLIVLVAFSFASFTYIKGTPQYSLYKLRAAVEDHDADQAFQYFDIDSIADNLFQELLKSQEEKQPINDWERMGQNMGKAMLAMMLPTLKETLKSQVKTAIQTPTEDKTKFSTIHKGSLSDFDVKVDGKTAIISKKNDDSTKFKMIKTHNGYWKIVQIITTDLNASVQQ